MCGISVILSQRVEGLTEAISNMVSVLSHRGPDGHGTYVDQISQSSYVALGHNRLSIIDLTEHAAQPMKSRDGRYVLIFNGEVYNYREVAQQLDRGELPKGNYGDTAVVLAALAKWGPQALPKFNGMWAIVLYDSLQKTLLISRDRFGVKPLYYWKDEDRFYLASEIKSILTTTSFKFSVNPIAAIPYLTRGLLNCSQETFFKGIQEFPAASYQVFDLSQAKPWSPSFSRFWLHPFEQGEEPSLGHISVEQIRATFIEAVQLRLRSDVPIGVLLSGGVDSSSIVGVIAHLDEVKNLKVLSVISDDPASNEEPFIDLMGNFVHCSLKKVNVSNDPIGLLGNLSEACWFNDQPVLGPSDLAHLELMKAAKALGLKVILSGQGADEQLGGYNKFLYFYLAELLKSRHYLQAIIMLAQFAVHSNTLWEFRIAEAVRYLGKNKLTRATFISSPFQEHDTINIGFQGSYSKREWIDLSKTSIPALNHYEDRMSMSQSVEVRAPFLDFKLVECLARVHPSEKFNGGWTKAIFRKAIAGLIPKEIQYRRDKKGFNVPVDIWMRGAFKSKVLEMFNGDMRASALGLIEAEKLRALYQAFLVGRGYLNGRHFFRVYAFEIFLRRFADSLSL